MPEWQERQVFQPVGVRRLNRIEDGYCCILDGRQVSLISHIVIAGHGYWEPGSLPTQPSPSAAQPEDFLSFKAHFAGTDLPSDLMPLLAFPGGYGGMVHTDGGRVSLSCCIRRDRLAALRVTRDVEHSSEAAGEVVKRHILKSCRGAEKRCTMPGATGRGSRPALSGRASVSDPMVAFFKWATRPASCIPSWRKGSAWPCNRPGFWPRN